MQPPKPIKENMLPIYREIKTWNLLKSEDSIWELLQFVKDSWGIEGNFKIYREFRDNEKEFDETRIFYQDVDNFKKMAFTKIQPFLIRIYLESQEDSDNHPIIIALNDNLIFGRLCFPFRGRGKDWEGNEKVMFNFDIKLIGYNAYVERWQRLKNER